MFDGTLYAYLFGKEFMLLLLEQCSNHIFLQSDMDKMYRRPGEHPQEMSFFTQSLPLVSIISFLFLFFLPLLATTNPVSIYDIPLT